MSVTSELYGHISDIAYGKTFNSFLNDLKKNNWIVKSHDYKWEEYEINVKQYFGINYLYEIWEETNND